MNAIKMDRFFRIPNIGSLCMSVQHGMTVLVGFYTCSASVWQLLYVCWISFLSLTVDIPPHKSKRWPLAFSSTNLPMVWGPLPVQISQVQQQWCLDISAYEHKISIRQQIKPTKHDDWQLQQLYQHKISIKKWQLKD